MKLSKIRTIVAAAVFVILAICLIAGINMGTLSGFGWDSFSALCPLGAFTTMLATKTLVPRAVFSIIIMALLVLLVGRAFCGWICPVPLVEKIRDFFRSHKKRKQIEQEKHDEILDIAKFELGCGGKDGCGNCTSCKEKRTKLDSRHYVLGGALLSTAIFGFPVFCLICPIGLTFATVLVVWRLFAAADLTWSVVLIPLMLVIELVFLRKWCTRFCPMAGLMNLMSRFSRTLKPTIDDTKCLETTKGTPCSRCAMACTADINLRHPEYGERTLADCTRCHACVEACPTQAVSMPLVAKKGEKVKLAANDK
jgi:ferredoxin-type protein NapH